MQPVIFRVMCEEESIRRTGHDSTKHEYAFMNLERVHGFGVDRIHLAVESATKLFDSGKHYKVTIEEA